MTEEILRDENKNENPENDLITSVFQTDSLIAKRFHDVIVGRGWLDLFLYLKDPETEEEIMFNERREMSVLNSKRSRFYRFGYDNSRVDVFVNTDQDELSDNYNQVNEISVRSDKSYPSDFIIDIAAEKVAQERQIKFCRAEVLPVKFGFRAEISRKEDLTGANLYRAIDNVVNAQHQLDAYVEHLTNQVYRFRGYYADPKNKFPKTGD
jgi:hypothetical protein